MPRPPGPCSSCMLSTPRSSSCDKSVRDVTHSCHLVLFDLTQGTRKDAAVRHNTTVPHHVAIFAGLGLIGGGTRLLRCSVAALAAPPLDALLAVAFGGSDVLAAATSWCSEARAERLTWSRKAASWSLMEYMDFDREVRVLRRSWALGGDFSISICLTRLRTAPIVLLNSDSNALLNGVVGVSGVEKSAIFRYHDVRSDVSDISPLSRGVL